MDDVRLLKQREGGMHLLFVELYCSRQEIKGERSSNHGRDLNQPATWRNSIKPLHQRVAQRLWNPKRYWLWRALEIILSPQRRTQHTVCQFLDEERDTVGLFDNLLD